MRIKVIIIYQKIFCWTLFLVQCYFISGKAHSWCHTDLRKAQWFQAMLEDTIDFLKGTC